MAMDTHAQSVLSEHRRVWQEKAVLRRIYQEEFFARLIAARKPGGIAVEIGGGPGHLRELLPEIISTDIVRMPWLDAVADAQELPFRSCSVSNILGLDVAHHLAAPMKLLEEAQRILVPGGRLVLVEPWITPFSYLVYRYFHQEGCDLTARPWEKNPGAGAQEKKAFDGNPAIPYLLFGPRHLRETLGALPGLRLVRMERFCLFAYLLSMGFQRWNLLPEALYPAVAKCERATLPLWRSLAALRILLVLEKSA
ncbi:MAG: methyltransferase domain-containing protein [Acidobacteriia bacterium]|nr:methyltransferase domain-containing protein [Terriglobia bacterium]